MHSSIFNFSVLLKGSCAGAAIIGLAWAVTPDHFDFDEVPVAGVGALNQLILEQYTYEYSKKPVVLLGSSILTSIPPKRCRPEQVATLYLQGRSAFTGLELMKRIGAVPEVVFIETSTLRIGPDTDLMDSVLTPIYWQVKSVIPPLRYNRNWIVLLYRYLLAERNPAASSILLPDISVDQWKYAMRERMAAFQSEFRDDSSIERIMPQLVREINSFREKGTRVILFDPIDSILWEKSPNRS